MEKTVSRKHPVLPIKKFPSVLPRNAIWLQHLLFNFCSISCQVVEVKNKRKFQIVSSKSGCGRLREVVAYSDLTWKLLPFLEN